MDDFSSSYYVVVDGDSKPVKAVYKRIQALQGKAKFNTHHAIDVFRALGFQFTNTKVPVSLIGTSGAGDNAMLEREEAFKTQPLVAVPWSFPIGDDAQKQLRLPFWLYINVRPDKIKRGGPIC